MLICENQKKIRSRGGKCIPCQVDHENDAQIASLFEQIDTEQNGRLDILVNNAYKGVNVRAYHLNRHALLHIKNRLFKAKFIYFKTIFENSSLKFWEVKPEIWDDINNVGLRYIFKGNFYILIMSKIFKKFRY